MVSVIRLDSDEVQKWCDAGNQDVDEDNKVQIASYLCPVRVILLYPEMRLVAAGAFHTSLMEPAVSRLEAALAATEIRRPRIPVVTSPVQGETTVTTLLAKGLKKSYELGPGKVIAGIVKRMDKKADTENSGA
ncbi:hypothetical protein OIU78_018739 [Salix suchowensis]|nr:hypothetical protein OIU78_018739 [Salix suchowensis]